MGTVILKEDMSKYNFGANAWIENETYVPFKYDCTDLVEQIEMILSDYDKFENIITNMREKYLKEYDPHKLCLHWYNIFKNIEGVKQI